MPISVEWDNETKTRIFYVFEGHWTWHEFDAIYKDVYAMLDTVSHNVDAIVDIRKSHLLPRNTLTEMRRLTFQQHENGGLTIFITENHFAQTLFRILINVLPRARAIFRMVASKEDALIVLENEEMPNTVSILEAY